MRILYHFGLWCNAAIVQLIIFGDGYGFPTNSRTPSAIALRAQPALMPAACRQSGITPAKKRKAVLPYFDEISSMPMVVYINVS
jgi:hypothetical protein